MAIYVFERCEPDSKDRCQSLAFKGNQQCPYKACEGSKYCARHAANASRPDAKKAEALYMVGRYRERINKQATSGKLKTLSEEVAILRMTLEAKLESLSDDVQLLMQAGQITEMVREIAKTVKSCHDLEVALNTVLDRTQAETWLIKVSEIATKYIVDPDLVEMMAEEMMESLNAALGHSESVLR